MVCDSIPLEVRYSVLLEASYDRGREGQCKEMDVIISVWS